MSFTRFAAIVAGTLVVTLSLALSLLVQRGPAALATLVGALLAALNAFAAYALVRYSRDRSTLVFMRAVLGGMTLRMGVMLLAIVVALRLFQLEQVPLIFSLLTHFALFLALELFAVHSSSTRLEAAR